MKLPTRPSLKADISKLAMWQGFVITILAFVTSYLKPEIAIHIAAIYASYAILQSVGMGTFNGANVLSKKWRNQVTKIESSSQTTVTGTGAGANATGTGVDQ